MALAALALAGAVVALAQPDLGDYTHTRAATNTDNAAPLIDVVLRGDLGRVPASQPVMGPVSVVLRLPFAGVGRALGGRQLEYWLGCVACLWALALLAIVLAARVRRREGGLAAPAVVVLVLVANPLTLAALDAGHPEELLAGALACAAVIAASGDRRRLTGLLLGLALATKPWAALAVPVVFAALPRGRRREAMLLAGGLAVVLVAPLALADPHRFLGGSHELTRSMRVYPASAWWPFAHHVAANSWSMPLGLTRSAGQLLAAGLAAVAGLVAVRGGRTVSAGRALALLAGVMLARCAVDPLNLAYYAIPFMVALVAWESTERRGLPVVALTASVLAWATGLHPAANPELACALYLAWSVPLAALLLTPGRGRSRAIRPDFTSPSEV
ncbi:MAG: glycosyltransferase 87 family protein [Thermoleophilaceae bacterium]